MQYKVYSNKVTTIKFQQEIYGQKGSEEKKMQTSAMGTLLRNKSTHHKSKCLQE